MTAAKPALASLQPRPTANPEKVTFTVSEAERVLTDWFGRPVLLLASGRSGLFLLMRHAGLVRADSAIEISRFHSRCVINALTYHAIPVIAPAEAAACLLFHQFGFPQTTPGRGFVIEDLAHAFYASPGSGERSWAGDFAIFSLPKFFGAAGLGGGIIARTPEQIAALRSSLDEFPRASDEVRAWMRRVYVDSFAGDGGEDLWLAAMYELLFAFPAPDPPALAGVPATAGELAMAGARRAELVEIFRAHFPAAPPGLWPDSGVVPYGLPFFARGGAELDRAQAEARAGGLAAEPLHIDVRRDMNASDYRRCLLLPAHHEVERERFESVCRALVPLAA